MKLSSLIGQTLDEKYFIDKQLGKGGMGAVFLATHLGTGRPVAVKVIAPQFMANDEFVERFKREAKAAGRLRHPNVVDVTDFGFAHFDAHRLAYLVMEYLDGCSLGDILIEESRLPLEWVVDILEQTCSAVDEAHKQGVVHRDLKPDNIWLEPNRRSGYTVKVLDFGLAKLGDPSVPELEESLTNSTSDLTGESQNKTEAISRDCLGTKVVKNTKTTQVVEFTAHTQAVAPENNTHTPEQTAEAKTQVLQPAGAQTRIAYPEQMDTPVDETATLVQPAQTQKATITKAQATVTEEIKTLVLQPPADDETQTRIQVIAEQDTRILTQDLVDPEHPRILSQQHIETHQTFSFDNSEGLTRVGSVLGTPLYMSPEQCNSQPLDARADIYSLGVIAYQMLSGVTPFSGDMATVMQHHIDTPPPSFKEVKLPPQRQKRKYKIPKRTEEIIMSALSKDPADRPVSATAFASALRATSEGSGALLRRAFALYSEYFPKFFMASLIVNLPGILLYGLVLLNTVLLKTQVISMFSGVVVGIIFGLLKFLLSFLASSVLSSVTVWMVTHLMLAPLRPVRVRRAFAAVKKKLRPVIMTTALFTSLLILSALLIVPAFIFMITYALTMPVVMMENVSGRAAMRRAKALAKRSKRTVALIVVVQFGMPFVASLIIGILIGLYGQAYPHTIDQTVAQRITEFIRIPIDLLIVPLISIMTGLLYLKMRLAGGEDLNQILTQFEDTSAPQTNWQRRMRERLSIMTHPSK